MISEPDLTIGEVSERSGVAPSGLRYYESLGLIESERTAGNQRRYGRSALRRVAFIRTASRIGLSLDEIRDALATLPEGRTPTKKDWTRLSRSWRPRLDARIA
ncbi:redox-sensitive transcriptional activator SoxR, partial [Mumia sp.]